MKKKYILFLSIILLLMCDHSFAGFFIPKKQNNAIDVTNVKPATSDEAITASSDDADFPPGHHGGGHHGGGHSSHHSSGRNHYSSGHFHHSYHHSGHYHHYSEHYHRYHYHYHYHHSRRSDGDYGVFSFCSDLLATIVILAAAATFSVSLGVLIVSYVFYILGIILGAAGIYYDRHKGLAWLGFILGIVGLGSLIALAIIQP